MKHIPYNILVICFALFAGCQKSNEQPESMQAVGFDVTGVEQTRAAAITSAENIVSLGIFGYSTGTASFDPTNASHTANPIFIDRKATRAPGLPVDDWVYTPVAYWPIDLTINNTFFAYSPHSDDFPAEANASLSNAAASGFPGYPVLNCTIPENVGLQRDILWSGPVENINRNTNNGKVLYEMKHALSWIQFLVAPIEKSNSSETYTITSLSLKANGLATGGSLNLGTGAWTNVTTASANYVFNPVNTPIPVGDVEPAVVNNDCLMLIPQNITHANVDISFLYFNGSIPDPDEYSYSIPFPEMELIAGKITVCVLRISAEGTPIIFWYTTDNDIEKWDDGHPDLDVGEFEVY